MAIAEAARADIVIKASGVGVFDDVLLEGVMGAARPEAVRLFWDVDAPATLSALQLGAEQVLRHMLPRLHGVLTYGGGPPVVRRYLEMGARFCRPIYNALDPQTHHPVPADLRFAADLNFLANRLPDREARVEAFFVEAARLLPRKTFLLGGNGWGDKGLPANVRTLGHVGTNEHNAFNTSSLPATRVFEAAGAGACLITDAWVGIEQFLAPDREILVARDGQDVAEHLERLTPSRAREIGAAARARILAEHTYAQRGADVDEVLRALVACAS
jgi:spore maturation protein CgeB